MLFGWTYTELPSLQWVFTISSITDTLFTFKRVYITRMMMWWWFFLACEDFCRTFDNSFLRFKWRLACANFTVYARISPQWLSELRRL